MSQKEYILEFGNITDEKAGRYANELRDFILQEMPNNIEVKRRRDNPDAQDFGTTLLIIATPFLLGVGNGILQGAGEEIGKNLGKKLVEVIFEWLAKRREVNLTIKTSKEITLLDNVTHKDSLDKIEKVFSL